MVQSLVLVLLLALGTGGRRRPSPVLSAALFGTNDLFFKLTGNRTDNLFNFDWWQFQ